MNVFVFLLLLSPTFGIPSPQIPLNILPSNSNGPLMLTPLITAGQYDQAKAQSAVTPFDDFPDIKSYSGYITTDYLLTIPNTNIFFWFLLAKNNPLSAPVILYMSGGPGTTSMYSLFGETGPFYVTPNQTLAARNCTWITKYNVIYVDAPPGGGYSYTNNYSTSDAQVGLVIYKFVKQFFKLFSEFSSNEFYVAGESYGGRFAVNAAKAIHDNKKPDDNFNLTGVITLSGFLDPPRMWDSADVLYDNGFLDKKEYDYWKAQTAVGKALLNVNNFAATIIIAPMMIFSLPYSPYTTFTGYESYFNSDLPKDPPALSDFADFIQTPAFKQRIHVGNNTLHYGLQGTLLLKAALANDLPNSNIGTVSFLLNNKYRYLMLSGQRDLLVNPRAQRQFIENLTWFGASLYEMSPRIVWTAPGQQLVTGYVTQAANLDEIMIRDAGHNIANDQPCVVFSALDTFLSRGSYFGSTPVIPAVIQNCTDSPFYKSVLPLLNTQTTA